MSWRHTTGTSRGVDFLHDLHRLNVAVSRAKALTVIVASPDLLDAEVHTPEQLHAVNALCHYVETSLPRENYGPEAGSAE